LILFFTVFLAWLAGLILLLIWFLKINLRLKKSNYEVNKVFHKLYLLDSSPGDEVIILGSDDPAWLGKAPYIKERVEFLINVSRRLGFLKESMFSVRIGVVENISYYDALTETSCIVINKNSINRNNEYLDNLLAHEFSHVITWDEKDEHGKIWKKTYKILLERLRKL